MPPQPRRLPFASPVSGAAPVRDTAGGLFVSGSHSRHQGHGGRYVDVAGAQAEDVAAALLGRDVRAARGYQGGTSYPGGDLRCPQLVAEYNRVRR